MKKIAVLILGIACLSACGKSNGDHFNETERNLPPVGELGVNVKEILDNEWAEDCDQTLGGTMRDLSRILDLKATEISKFASEMKSTENYKLVPFGLSFLREINEDKTLKDEWLTDDESWADLEEYYQKIKDQPINKNWIRLNNGVRSIIMNDQMRVLDGRNLGLKHDSAPKIDSLLLAVQSCIDNSNCLKLNLAPSDSVFADETEIYYYYISKFSKTKDKVYLEKFSKRLKFDQGRYHFYKNETLKITKENGKTILLLPLDGINYDQAQQKQVSSYVESVWNDSELSLKLSWMDSVKDIFKMFFDITKTGERAYVMFSSKEVHLFPLTGTRSIAHEFGHVLGFKDHYYTTWNASACKYVTEYNPGDLMSDSWGNVTADEWKVLKSNYSL